MIGTTTTTTLMIRRQLVSGIRRRRPLVASSSSVMSRRQQSSQQPQSPSSLHHRLLSSSTFHFNHPLAPHYLNENHHHSPRVQRLHNKFSHPQSSSTSIIRHFSSSSNNNSNHDNDDDKETKQQSQQQFATIIQPPIRSRPFRSFKGARAPQTRTPPRRIPLSTRNSNSKTVSNNNNPDTSMTTSNHNELFPMAETAATRGTYPVRAVHAAQSIDLAAVISKVFATKGVKKMIERLSVVIQLPPTPLNGGAGNHHQGKQFIAIFRFGSVVFFNVSPREVARYLWLIKQQSTDPVLTGVEHKETFCVHIRPNENYHPEQQSSSSSSSPVTGEYCIVPELNMKSVDVISNVMAQSVALDAYNDTVDELLASFASINQVVKGSGQLTTVEQTSLFRTVAQNNSIFIDMVSKLGIKDRSDTAWNLSQYEDIHEGMKEEFEIYTRFKDIEFKLNLIQENAKFFLEVLHNQKSNTLEWIIIVLILFECILMCLEMSGLGPEFFQTVSELTPK